MVEYTARDNFKLNWLNVDNDKSQITVRYLKQLVLDEEKTIDIEPKTVIISGDKFNNILGLPLMALSEDIIQNMTLGELISGLTSFAVKYADEESFPQTEKETQYLSALSTALFTTEQPAIAE